MGIVNRFISGLKTSIHANSKKKSMPDGVPVDRIIFGKSLQNLNTRIFSRGKLPNRSYDFVQDAFNLDQVTQNGIIRKIQDYSFLRSVVEAIEIPITDVIRKSTWDFSISPLEGALAHEESKIRSIQGRLKKVLATFDIAEFVRKELTDWLLYGFQVYYLQVENDQIYVSKVVSDNALACFHRGKYVSVDLGGTSNSAINQNGARLDNMYSVPYIFEKKVFRDITEEQAVREGMLNKPEEELSNISDFILEFQKVYGVGFLENVASDLFNLYLREIVYDWLSMLEIIQPKLIGITMSGDRVDVPDITKAVTDIEGMLNGACATLIQAGMGGQNIEPVLYSMMANRYQLVAFTQQTSSIDEIEVTNLNETLKSMQEDIQQKKLYILQNKGIPEELHNGEGNRWEIIARTDKYLDNIKRSCVSIESFVKQFIFSLCAQLGYEDYILSTDQINFNLDVSALTSNYVENSGFSFLSEKLEDLSSLLKSTEEICELDVIDADKIKKLVADKIQEIDPSVSSAIKFNEDGIDDEVLNSVDELAEKMIDISEEKNKEG